jgi:hypothetical protein
MKPKAYLAAAAFLCIALPCIGFAQTGGRWVDPPLDFEPVDRQNNAAPPENAGPQETAGPQENAGRRETQPPASQQGDAPTGSGPPVESKVQAEIRKRAGETRRLAVNYLEHWSRVDEMSVEEVISFYAPSVRFYGKNFRPEDVLEEKRRFIERWPIRDYAALPENMSVGCRADAGECRIETMFSYEAANPRTGRKSQGLGSLKLVVDFASGRPLITSESSRVLDRGQTKLE